MYPFQHRTLISRRTFFLHLITILEPSIYFQRMNIDFVNALFHSSNHYLILRIGYTTSYRGETPGSSADRYNTNITFRIDSVWSNEKLITFTMNHSIGWCTTYTFDTSH